MKKKIALLLAAVMTLALLPTNVFAGSTNSLSKSAQLVPESTVFVEQGYRVDDVEVHPGANWRVDADWYVNGTNLIVYLDTDVTTDSTFTLTLENAEWFFNGGGRAATSTRTQDEPIFDPARGNYVNAFTKPNGTVVKRYTRLGHLGGGTATAITKFDKDYYELGYTLDVSNVSSKIATVTLAGSTADLRAKSALTGADQAIIVIPILAKSTDAGYASVKVTGGTALNMSSSSNVFAQTGGGATKTWAAGTVTRYSSFTIDRLIIQESRLRTLANGTFTLTADNGFDFSIPVEDTVTTKGTTILDGYRWQWNAFYTAATLPDPNPNGFQVGDPIIAMGGYLLPVTSSNNYDFDVYRVTKDFRDTVKVYTEGGFPENTVVVTDMYFRAINSSTSSQKYDPSVLYVTIDGLAPSTRLPGTLYIQNEKYDSVPLFTFTAQSNAPSGDWQLEIKNYKDTEITTEKFKAGTRKDYYIELTAGDPTTLYNGLYEYTEKHANHLAAEVKFAEVLKGAWLADRVTTLTLPEGVKIRALEITDYDGILMTSGQIEETSYYPLTTTQGKVFVDGNTITFTELSREDNDLAFLKMKLWLSIESGFTGDITLTASGTGLGGAAGEIEPVVIAKALDPIIVEVDSITDIKLP